MHRLLRVYEKKRAFLRTPCPWATANNKICCTFSFSRSEEEKENTRSAEPACAYTTMFQVYLFPLRQGNPHLPNKINQTILS